jgi:hypothetical protein
MVSSGILNKSYFLDGMGFNLASMVFHGGTHRGEW